jgi:hypothetical protein
MLLYLIGLPTALIMGIAGNLLTPMARGALATRSEKRRKTRIAEIREQVELFKLLRARPSAAAAAVGTRVITTLGIITLATGPYTAGLVLLGNSKPTVSPSVATMALGVGGVLLLMIASYSVSQSRNIFKAIYDPEWYAEKINAQLQKLGVEIEASKTDD